MEFPRITYIISCHFISDSLCIEVRGFDDVYEQLGKFKEIFDFSNLSKTHPLHSTENHMTMGMLKDEMAGKLILEFCGLRPKMYSILSSELNIRKAKGVSEAVNRCCLRHTHYKQCLFSEKTMTEIVTRIGSEAHKVYTYQTSKVVLSCFEDKRHLLNPIESLAYGNCKIEGKNET